eukprot:3362088-Alexandrium_andersonii.AAC.1
MVLFGCTGPETAPLGSHQRYNRPFGMASCSSAACSSLSRNWLYSGPEATARLCLSTVTPCLPPSAKRR